MQINNIQDYNTKRTGFGAKLQILQRHHYQGKAVPNNELIKKFEEKAKAIGSPKDLIKINIGPLYADSKDYTDITAKYIKQGGKVIKKSTWENGIHLNSTEQREYENGVIEGFIDEVAKLIKRKDR